MKVRVWYRQYDALPAYPPPPEIGPEILIYDNLTTVGDVRRAMKLRMFAGRYGGHRPEWPSVSRYEILDEVDEAVYDAVHPKEVV